MRILKGEGEPSKYAGSVGDYFVDVRRWVLFGPKERAAWPPGRPLWPDGRPRVVPDLSDDLPLAQADGAVLTTGAGLVLMGDPPR